MAVSPAALAMDGCRDRLRAQGHVRIEPFLEPGDAALLHRHLAGELAWSRTFHQGGRTRELDPAALGALEARGLQAVSRIAEIGADTGFRYLYDVVRVPDDPGERRARGLAIDRLFERFNQSDWLALFRHLTGDDRIACVSGSATRYLAGHFLTCHRDDAQDEGRLFAFVLNVTSEWRADWGGLLQFHDAGGDIASGLVPRFNSLHVFAVPQPHSVSQVATFAPVQRLAISGWLRETG